MAGAFETLADEDLARETQAGSLAAFEQLVFRYEGRVYAFLRNSCPCETDAREITQDTFVRAFQAIGQYDCRQPFTGWLFTIARRKSVDRYRSAPPATNPLVDEGADLADPSEILARQEDQQQLWQLARSCLSPNQFQALWLRYREDMSVAETARVLRKTSIHVKVLLFRARGTLARVLGAPQPNLMAAKPAAGNHPTPAQASGHRNLTGAKVVPSTREGALPSPILNQNPHAKLAS